MKGLTSSSHRAEVHCLLPSHVGHFVVVSFSYKYSGISAPGGQEERGAGKSFGSYLNLGRP